MNKNVKSKYIPGQKIEVKYTGFATSSPDLLDPLTNEDLASFTTYDGEAIIRNQYGKICARVFKGKISSQVHHDATKAVTTLFSNLLPILDPNSFHHGPWRTYDPFSFTSSELLEAVAFYQGTGYSPLWQNKAIKEICNKVDGRFSAMSNNVFKQYCDIQAPRYYTKSFTMCVINKGGTAPHYDYKDEPEGYCCVVPLGDFSGGELVFREHKLRFSIKPGDIIFFHSRNMLHENLAFTGERYSLVFTTHHNMFTEFGQPVNRIGTYNQYIQHPLKAQEKLALLSEEEIEELKLASVKEPSNKEFSRRSAKETRVQIELTDESTITQHSRHRVQSYARH